MPKRFKEQFERLHDADNGGAQAQRFVAGVIEGLLNRIAAQEERIAALERYVARDARAVSGVLEGFRGLFDLQDLAAAFDPVEAPEEEPEAGEDGPDEEPEAGDAYDYGRFLAMRKHR